MTERCTGLCRRIGLLALPAFLAAAPAAWVPAAWAQGASTQGAADPLWDRSQRDLLPRLNAALESSPSNVASDWSDPATGLSGTVTVLPAVSGVPPCRRFRVTVSGPDESLTGEGIRCREAAGLWNTTGVPDRVVALDPTLRLLQQDLRRLAYYDGPADGTASNAFNAALASFAADEQVTGGAAATAAMHQLATAAIARIPPPGSCPGSAGHALVCGTVR